MLPSWLDYSFSENIAASMFRGLRGPVASWGELIAAAQAILSYYQDVPGSQTESLYDEQEALPLIAAARILDAASQPPSGRLPEEQTNLALTAALAFGMYGNFPSASASARRAFPDFAIPSPSIAVLFATIAPTHLRRMIPFCESKSIHRRYLELLETYIYTGDQSIINKIRDLFIECLLSAETSFEGSLFRSARLCLSHIFRLSVFRVLNKECPGLGSDYIYTLVDNGVRVLLPPQYKAIVKHRITSRMDNAIIALPPSTGKTWLGELCLVSALNQNAGIACYVAPYVALGNQVAQSISEHLPKNYKIHRLMGGFQDIEQLDPENNLEVLVATPERLDLLLRASPHLLEHFRCVVCDEAHILENESRGIRLEGLLTRLRMLQEKEYKIRLVLLSAVLSKYDALQDWMNVPDDFVVTNSWKPTARRLAFWKQDGRLLWYVGGDALRRDGHTNDSVIGESLLPWPESNFYPTKHIGQVRTQESGVYSNVAYLAEVLSLRYEGPILCACATKQGTRSMATALAKRFPELERIPPNILTAISKIQSHHQFLMPMCDLLRRGVAFHNSTVPHEVRQLIEIAAKNRELKVVAATTTLAEGVDLPFRFTIL